MKNNNSLNSKSNISVFTIATDTYGNIAGIVASGLFIILMLSTLIAQLSKVGILLPSLFSTIFTKETAISSFAIVMSLLTFCNGIQFAERINSILTLTMILSFGSIITAAPGAGFDFSRLFSRSNFRSLLPFNLESSISWAIPVFLQLLVYTETIPLVVSRLNGNEKKVKKAIVIGSFIPLLMCIVWTMIAIGLVPAELAMTNTLTIDPVDILLKNSPSKRIKSSILLLTLSAIMTTIIGSCLTISQFLDDLFKDKKILSKLLSIMPATLIAACGTKDLYYAATHFAGAFPVTLLWGLFPPLAYLKTMSDKRKKSPLIQSIGQYVLIFLSITMLAINLY
jgi:tyrosine-specific transport protein